MYCYILYNDLCEKGLFSLRNPEFQAKPLIIHWTELFSKAKLQKPDWRSDVLIRVTYSRMKNWVKVASQRKMDLVKVSVS